MRLETSASKSEEKDVNECMFTGKMLNYFFVIIITKPVHYNLTELFSILIYFKMWLQEAEYLNMFYCHQSKNYF